MKLGKGLPGIYDMKWARIPIIFNKPTGVLHTFHLDDIIINSEKHGIGMPWICMVV
ncbi:MAG: hypothetical protein KQI35_09190 [Bacteroidetes bacterium]|nr:hypothetical protein [Bacteroidota bacterium]